VQDPAVARLPDSFLREVQERLSIVELVGQYVQLTPKRGEHWGRCPFHSEKSASFKVSESRKAFKCFGCGKGGGLFKFFMELEGLGFRQAVEELGNRVGLQMPKEDLSPEQRQRLSRRQKLLEANQLACSYFQSVLTTEAGRSAREELSRREIPQELVEKYKLGMAPDSWDGLASHFAKRGMDPRVAEAAGLLLPKRSGDGFVDRFRNRLMFPIRARDGKVVAFGGRTLGDDRAKYLNSPETDVYIKGRTLYGFHLARHAIQREGKVLVVEGYFDVLGLVKAGLGFAVASCGTALTQHHLKALSQQTPNIVMMFDSDEAGVRAAMKSAELSLAQGLWPTWLSVPDGKDPDDYVRQHGGEAMRALLEREEAPLLDFYIREKARAAGSNLHSRARVLTDVAPLLVGQPETVLQVYEMLIAELVGVDPMVVRQQLRHAAAAQRGQAQRDARRAIRGPESADGSGLGGPAPSGPDEGGPLGGGPNEGAPLEPVAAAEGELIRLLAQSLDSLAHDIGRMGARSWVSNPEVGTVVDRFLAASSEGRLPTALDLLGDIQNPAVHSVVYDALTDDTLRYTQETLPAAVKVCFVRLYDGSLERKCRELDRQRALLESVEGADVMTLAQIGQQKVDIERERQKLRQQLCEVS
jgi:DNA primase